MGTRNFIFKNIGSYAVFDGLSEYEIKISNSAICDQNMVKIQNDKKWQKQVLHKNGGECCSVF